MTQFIDPFPQLIAPILVLEGGYSDNPNDPGGPTAFGIDNATAAAAGYTGLMSAMTVDQATTIYRRDYWQGPHFDKIYPILPDLANYMLQVGINVGPETAGRFLQRGLNVLSDQGTLYDPLVVDGQCGPATRAALTSYLNIRASEAGEAVLMGVMRSLAVSHYISIAEIDPNMQAFEYGWLRNRALGLQ